MKNVSKSNSYLCEFIKYIFPFKHLLEFNEKSAQLKLELIRWDQNQKHINSIPYDIVTKLTAFILDVISNFIMIPER